MPKELCLSCKKPIDKMDFYFAYPNGKVCSACTLKNKHGVKDCASSIGKKADPDLLDKENARQTSMASPMLKVG